MFSYFGTPDTFRIAVYDDSQQKVNFSEVMKRTQLQQVFTCDFADNTVKTGNPLLTYLKQFASSLLPTLLLEGILLLPFGFWDRRNAKLFFVVNIGTAAAHGRNGGLHADRHAVLPVSGICAA